MSGSYRIPKGWRPVVFAADCSPCPDCDEPVCLCGKHYTVCSCPGPTQDDRYEYQTLDGRVFARRLTSR